MMVRKQIKGNRTKGYAQNAGGSRHGRMYQKSGVVGYGYSRQRRLRDFTKAT